MIVVPDSMVKSQQGKAGWEIIGGKFVTVAVGVHEM